MLGDADGGTAMFSRSISDGRTLAGWLRPGMPVRKIVTRSLRGAGGESTLKIRFSSFGTSGSVTRSSATASLVGSMPLNASLRARSITASLTSGLPSRDTCTSAPVCVCAPADSVRVAKRLAVDHTPMIALGSVALDGTAPLRVERRIGSWIASVLTLKPAVLSSTWPEPTPSRSKTREVDVEALVALPGEDARCCRAAAECRRQGAVVGRRARPDVGRRHRQPARELAQVPVRRGPSMRVRR